MENFGLIGLIEPIRIESQLQSNFFSLEQPVVAKKFEMDM